MGGGNDNRIYYHLDAVGAYLYHSRQSTTTRIPVKTIPSNHSGETLVQEIERGLTDRYGPVLGGKALHQVLGYPTAAAFRQAMSRGTVAVPIFEIPKRRGRFALARDVALWLVQCRANAMTHSVGSGAPPAQPPPAQKKEEAMD